VRAAVRYGLPSSNVCPAYVYSSWFSFGCLGLVTRRKACTSVWLWFWFHSVHSELVIFQLLDQTQDSAVGFVTICLRLRIFCLLLDPLPLEGGSWSRWVCLYWFNFNNHRCFVLPVHLGFGDRDTISVMRVTLEILQGESWRLADLEHIITWNILGFHLLWCRIGF
jgi:hypothetical protein